MCVCVCFQVHEGVRVLVLVLVLVLMLLMLQLADVLYRPGSATRGKTMYPMHIKCVHDSASMATASIQLSNKTMMHCNIHSYILRGKSPCGLESSFVHL